MFNMFINRLNCSSTLRCVNPLIKFSSPIDSHYDLVDSQNDATFRIRYFLNCRPPTGERYGPRILENQKPKKREGRDDAPRAKEKGRTGKT